MWQASKHVSTTLNDTHLVNPGPWGFAKTKKSEVYSR